MKYKEIKAEGFLSHFIKCFWTYQNDHTATAYTILPDGNFDLIIEFKEEHLQNIMLTGVWTKPVDVTIEKDTKLFAIRFKLLAAEYIFKQEIRSVLDTTISLPPDFWEIDMLDLSDFEQVVTLLSHRISLSLKHLKKIDDRKIKLFETIYQHQHYNVQQISGEVCWSSRQINRYFTQQYGFSLKTFLSIVRCNASYPDIAGGKLFPAGDYFDQAHFIKEIRKYTGVTPKDLLKNKNDRFLQLSTMLRK